VRWYLRFKDLGASSHPEDAELLEAEARHVDGSGPQTLRPPHAEARALAFATAASPGVMPPSLPPCMPSGLVVDGTSLISVRNSGRLSARGTA
jgi:hypothetical protein